MAPETISEHLISKIFWGSIPPDPPSLVCLLIPVYTLDIDVTPLQKILPTGLENVLAVVQ